MGKVTTGKFETRADLVDAILTDYFTTDSSMAQISRMAGVSESLVATIINNALPTIIRKYREKAIDTN